MIDKYKNRDHITICLKPGIFSLQSPLRLGPEHSNLTIEACHDGAILEALAENSGNFTYGLISIAGAESVTLRGIRFEMPSVAPAMAKRFTPKAFITTGSDAAFAALASTSVLSIGVQAVQCAMLHIEECLFRFQLPQQEDLFAAGILLRGEFWNPKFNGNRFLHEEKYQRNIQRPYRFLAGLMQVPGAIVQAKNIAKAAVVGDKNSSSHYIQPGLLDGAIIEDNEFSGLVVAAMFFAQLGQLRIASTNVHDCGAGFIFLLNRVAFLMQHLNSVVSPASQFAEMQFLMKMMTGVLNDPLISDGLKIATRYPWPDHGQDVLTAKPVTFEASAATDKTHLVMQNNIRLAAQKMIVEKVPLSFTSADAAKTQNIAADVLSKVVDVKAAAAALPLLHLFEFGIFAKPTDTKSTTNILFHDNTVEAIVAGSTGFSAFFLVGDDTNTTSKLVMSGNIMRSFSPTHPTASVAMIRNVTATGNIIRNEVTEQNNDQYVSLALAPLVVPWMNTAVAVTGNVFHNYPRLPQRDNLTPPFDSWWGFNTLA